MPTPKRHPLVRADLQRAFAWYEDQESGLGAHFRSDFLAAYRRLCAHPELFAVRFAGIRRLNLTAFPYGIFYVLTGAEIRVLAVLHAKRRHRRLLDRRRRTL